MIMYSSDCGVVSSMCFFFQAEDGIRDLVRSRGLGDVYKRQIHITPGLFGKTAVEIGVEFLHIFFTSSNLNGRKLSLIHI